MLFESMERGYPLYLAGDIGGTKTLLGLYAQRDTELTLVSKKRFTSTDWQDLTVLIHGFLKEIALKPEKIAGGCLSLAGPLSQDKCLLTNLNRVIHFEPLHSTLNFQSPLHFVNDLEAMGHGLKLLEDGELLCLNPEVADSYPVPSKSSQNRALIAPGTGLGEAMITEDDRVYTSEAAHTDYAPTTEQEVRLWRYLAQKYGRVSYERVLSGPGIENIYQFLLGDSNVPSTYHLNLSAAEITKKALAGICPICTETLELFVKVLGAEAGNLALRTLAYGGIYLGGGIPPKIIPILREDFFLKALLSKGRLRDLLTQIPVYVVLNENLALLGAAKLASVHAPL